jgi:hypothetical protein
MLTSNRGMKKLPTALAPTFTSWLWSDVARSETHDGPKSSVSARKMSAMAVSGMAVRR